MVPPQYMRLSALSLLPRKEGARLESSGQTSQVQKISSLRNDDGRDNRVVVL